MQKGRPIRIPVNFDAEIIVHKRPYSVVIENFSENGLQIRTVPFKKKITLAKGTTFNLEFQIPSGEILNLPSEELLNIYSGITLRLYCRVIWSTDTLPEGLTKTIGLEITETSPTYDEFLKTLHISYMNIL